MYTREDVKKVQKRLLEMAKDIRDILESHEIPYFITYGTLLGAVRHKGFIPWDDDFDMYLLEERYDEALNILKDELPKDVFLEYWESEPKYFHAWAHVKDKNTMAECELFPQDGMYQHKGISIDLYKTKKIHEEEEASYRLSEHLSYLQKRRNVGLMDESTFRKKTDELQKKYYDEVERLKTIGNRGREIYAFNLIYNDRLFLDELFPMKKYIFEDSEFYGPANADALLKRCYGDYMKLPPIEKRHPHYSKVLFL